MTQDERWQRQYEEMMTFMENNHRRPSKHRLEEHYPQDRLEKFAILMKVADKYRRKNQYEYK